MAFFLDSLYHFHTILLTNTNTESTERFLAEFHLASNEPREKVRAGDDKPRWAPGFLHFSSTCRRVWVCRWPCTPTTRSRQWPSGCPAAFRSAAEELQQNQKEKERTPLSIRIKIRKLYIPEELAQIRRGTETRII